MIILATLSGVFGLWLVHEAIDEVFDFFGVVG